MLSKKFFVVSGKGVSRTSELNAFDAALFDAGIAQYNLVPVSSILAEGAGQIDPVSLDIGAVTFTVLARCHGKKGESIGAGIAWAFVKEPITGKEYGIVAEDSGEVSLDSIQKNLKKKLDEMANARKVVLKRVDSKVEILKVPENSFGCVVSALIYV